MDTMKFKVDYTEQESVDASAAVLDCMKGRIQPKPYIFMIMGFVFAAVAVAVFLLGRAILSRPDGTANDYGTYKDMIPGAIAAVASVYMFINAFKIKRRLKYGVTEEYFVYSLFTTFRMENGVEAELGKSNISFTPQNPALAVSVKYADVYRAFEYPTGLVVAAASNGPNTHFIPRRILTEHGGEIERILEKKLRRKYKIISR